MDYSDIAELHEASIHTGSWPYENDEQAEAVTNKGAARPSIIKRMRSLFLRSPSN